MSRRIVVIEHEVSVLELLRDVLEMEDFSVVGIDDPGLVQPPSQDPSPDLFLIAALPGTSGAEIAQRLRKQGFASTPMIALAPTSAAGAGSDFDDFLDDPFDVEALLECVERYLAGPAVRPK